MTREQWLEACWKDLRQEVRRVRMAKEQRGGQHVPCHSSLLILMPSGLNELDRRCRDALETSAEWYSKQDVSAAGAEEE